MLKYELYKRVLSNKIEDEWRECCFVSDPEPHTRPLKNDVSGYARHIVRSLNGE